MEYLVSLQFLVILVILSPRFFFPKEKKDNGDNQKNSKKKKKYKHADKAEGKDDRKNS